jgi:hypothetical protein
MGTSVRTRRVYLKTIKGLRYQGFGAGPYGFVKERTRYLKNFGVPACGFVENASRFPQPHRHDDNGCVVSAASARTWYLALLAA